MMFCDKCGSQVSDNARFCPNCGSRIQKEERKNDLPLFEELKGLKWEDAIEKIENKRQKESRKKTAKKAKRILLWIITAYLLIFALAYIKNFAGVLFLAAVLFIVPIEQVRIVIERFIPKKSVRILIPVVLFFVACFATPTATNPEGKDITPQVAVKEVEQEIPTQKPEPTNTLSVESEQVAEVVVTATDEPSEEAVVAATTGELSGEVVAIAMDEPEVTMIPEELPEDSTFEIHFLDVGQADAALIICDEEAMLIDGGNSEDSDFIYAYLEEHEITYLDYIVATHGHEDHVGGLSGALNYAMVGRAYCSVTEYDSEAFSDFLKYLGEQEIGITVPSAGDSFMLGSADVTILGPINESDDPNNTSIVLRVVYGDTSFLFTGDAEREEEQDILDAGYKLKSTVLKVGHHGSESSTTYPFLYEIEPEYAVISVGEDNSYGHPTEAVLSRLRDADVAVYRTDMQGTVICESDGQKVTFSVERNADADTREAVSVTAAPAPTPEPTPEPTPQFKVEELSRTMYASTGVNVRSGPGTDYDVQGALSVNDDVYVTGETENGWYQIEYYGDVGYVKGSYLSDDMVEITPEPQSETMVWKTKTGSKYHNKPNCGSTKNATQIALSQAEALGLEPCKNCY